MFRIYRFMVSLTRTQRTKSHKQDIILDIHYTQMLSGQSYPMLRWFCGLRNGLHRNNRCNVISTPMGALNTLLNIPSLSYHLGQARMSTYRPEQTGHWKHLAKGHSSLGSAIVEDDNLMMPSDYAVPDLTFDRFFDTLIP